MEKINIEILSVESLYTWDESPLDMVDVIIIVDRTQPKINICEHVMNLSLPTPGAAPRIKTC